MAQTKEGAIKVAAKKAGLSVEEYLFRIESGLKKCTGCKEWKPKGLFDTDNSRWDGLQSKCQSCDMGRYGKKDVGTSERRKMNKLGLKWCARCERWLFSKEVSKGLCKFHQRETQREQYAKNPEPYKRNSMLRRLDPIPFDELDYLFRYLNGMCAYCSESDAESWDHIIPVSKGGKSEPGNLVPVCKSCNSSKNDRDLIEWMGSKGLKPTEKLLSIIRGELWE